ncbi:Flp family type IVb pilin [Prosthecomicrobium sp. N25]|uniref:Flp family type IVb pilin n=1 Tax=Prosthecomicrobium sp. N25 TaxID=3129254 RepID=UPI003077AB52
MTKFARFLKDESGATAIEYGLIASLIAIAVIAGASALGNKLSDSFNYIQSQIKTS